MKYVIWLLAFGLIGCAQKPVVEPVDKPFDVTSAWTAVDADLMAQALVRDMLTFPWLKNFQQDSKGALPVLQVGKLEDMTSEKLDMYHVRETLNQQLLTATSVKSVAGEHGQADFSIEGNIQLLVQQTDQQRTARYSVVLNLIETSTQRQVWTGQYSVDKVQRRTPAKLRSN